MAEIDDQPSTLYHAGRAIFAALAGEEGVLYRELGLVLSHDVDGRHHRWACEELSFAPFRNLAWFQHLIAGTANP